MWVTAALPTVRLFSNIFLLGSNDMTVDLLAHIFYALSPFHYNI